MAARIIKELKGHSGSKIFLMTKHDRLFVRKQGNIARNLQSFENLEPYHIPVPEMYHMFDDTIDMEYIDGLDMATYLANHDPKPFVDFLDSTIDKFLMITKTVDYRTTIEQFLDLIDLDSFPFTAEDLLYRIPTRLTQSMYHGDLTLENILWNPDRGFVLIDGSSGIWNSYIFDLCKLRQDLDCHWFIRNSSIDLTNQLNYIKQEIFNRWPIVNNDALLILMLLRVYRYCSEGSVEQDFIKKEINRLWK